MIGLWTLSRRCPFEVYKTFRISYSNLDSENKHLLINPYLLNGDKSVLVHLAHCQGVAVYTAERLAPQPYHWLYGVQSVSVPLHKPTLEAL